MDFTEMLGVKPISPGCKLLTSHTATLQHDRDSVQIFLM